MNHSRYMKVIKECEKLVVSRNKQYGDSVDFVSIKTIAELCMMKLSRIATLGEDAAKTKDELQDCLNYLVFALEKYNNKQKEQK